MKKVSIKMLCYIIALFLSIIVMIFFSIHLIKAYKAAHPTQKSEASDLFDKYFDPDAKYIYPNASKNFMYNIKITVDNSNNSKDDLINLTYIIKINPENTLHTYKNIVVTALLDNQMQNYRRLDNIFYFGTDKSNPVTIDNKKCKAINISYTGLIDKGYDKNRIIDYLKLPIKLKVSWKKHVEYVNIVPSEESIIFK